MTDIPIIFSAPMVQALLARRKTQTRRLAWSTKPQPHKYADHDGTSDCAHGCTAWMGPFRSGAHADGVDPFGPCPKAPQKPTSWQKVKPGDRLWVRENWRADCPDDPTGAIYAADEAHRMPRGGKWRPSIHMPRWASRITLVVTATKIEPLWKISDEDAVAEGCVAGQLNDGFGPRDFGGGYTIESPGTWASASGMYQILWDKLHGTGAWDAAAQADTEIVALTFTVHKVNIDAMKEAA